ncbi:MAG: hypothetical protein ACREON_01115 [Gemmatimonadaceae bacterium]
MTRAHRLLFPLLFPTALLAAAAMVAAPSHAQGLRTVHAVRATTGERDSLTVYLRYVAGALTLATAHDSGVLYDVRTRFDPSRGTPEARFDPASRTLRVQSDSMSVRSRLRLGGFVFGDGDNKDRPPATMRIGLAPGVPLRLDAELTAVEGRLDLSGMSVSSLHLRSTASDTRLTFGTPNPVRVSEVEIRGTATHVEVQQLGNANAERVDVRVVAGSVDLDVSGAWSGTMELRLDVSLGEATLRVPSDVGVRLEWNGVLGDLSAPGLVERDGARVSENWSVASRKLIVDADARLGELDLQWIRASASLPARP